MSYRISLEILLGLTLLCPPALSPQMPPQPGKLVIKSEPTGARITINGNIQPQRTNSTFLVSPGSYQVSVGVKGEKTSCSVILLKVSPGETVERVCPGNWTSST